MVVGSVYGCDVKHTTDNDNLKKDSLGLNDETEVVDIDSEGEIEQKVEVSMEMLEAAEESPAEDFYYYEKDGEIVIESYTGKDAVVVIPDEIDGLPVVKLDKWVFSNNNEVVGIRVGNNVVDCSANGVFAQCHNLKYVILGEKVTKIGECAFNYTALEEIRLNEQLQFIGDLAFWNTSLKEIHLPASINEIGVGAFFDGITIYVKEGSYAEEYVKNYYSENYIIE